MSAQLALQRCWNHSGREAVARCPECTRFFCRECVVEHEDRVICSGCLARLHTPEEKPKRRWNFTFVTRTAGAAMGLILAWFLFFTVGRVLLKIPDDFHAQRMWERALADEFEEGAER
jgi:hypothetical protein